MAEEHADTPRPLAEISHGPSAFDAFLDRNQKGMIVLGIVIALAGGGWIVMKGIKESAATSAGEALSKAATLTELQAVLKEYPDTAAAGSAEILMSAEQWEAGDQDAAIEILRKFIAGNAGHPAIPTAKASLATRLMQQGKSEEASTLFREVADGTDSRYLAPYALVSLGDLEKAAGNTKEAEEHYTRASSEFKGNPFANLASQHLKLVSFKMPEEIEPPPAPEPKTGELPKPDFNPGGELSGEMKDNPLGNILNGEGATPAPPVEEDAGLPAKEEPAKADGEEQEKPEDVLPGKPGESEKPQPEKPADKESGGTSGGESN